MTGNPGSSTDGLRIREAVRALVLDPEHRVLLVRFEFRDGTRWALPGGGLDDNEHPSGTFAAFDFSTDNLSKYGWPMRNLTAMEVLNAVWRGVTQP